jgi:hypothetical protein
MLTQIESLDDILRAQAQVLGDDFPGYRNHAYRVLNFCAALSSPDPEQLEKMAIAVAFHDIAIWTDATFDYLQPSMEQARVHLDQIGRSTWIPEVDAMIQQHHKLSAYTTQPNWLVEPFRKADLVDVSRGIFRCGLPKALVREVFAAFPDQGFHLKLVQLSLKRFLTHPLSPLPMLKR